MQHFAITAATTTAVPGAGIILLVFSLTGYAVYNNVINAYITIATVIGKRNTNFATGICRCRIGAHAAGNRPALNSAAANLQGYGFVSGYPAHAYIDSGLRKGCE